MTVSGQGPDSAGAWPLPPGRRPLEVSRPPSGEARGQKPRRPRARRVTRLAVSGPCLAFVKPCMIKGRRAAAQISPGGAKSGLCPRAPLPVGRTLRTHLPRAWRTQPSTLHLLVTTETAKPARPWPPRRRVRRLKTLSRTRLACCGPVAAPPPPPHLRYTPSPRNCCLALNPTDKWTRDSVARCALREPQCAPGPAGRFHSTAGRRARCRSTVLAARALVPS